MDENEENKLRFSADIPSSAVAFVPGHTDVAQVRDVAVLMDLEAGDNPDERDQLIALPRFDRERRVRVEPDPIDLGRGLRIEALDHEERDRIIEACSPRGHYFRPIRQFGSAYSFVVDVEPSDWEEHLYRWDPDDRITDAIAMSRLIVDNGYSTQYAARVIEHESSEQQVAWMPDRAPAYRPARTRDWLTFAEADELRSLLGSYWDSELPQRVKTALWNFEFAATVRWLDVRMPLIVTALEALTTTSRDQAPSRFAKRLPQLVDAVGGESVGRNFCDAIYDARSRYYHGDRISMFVPRQDPDRAQPDDEGAQDEQQEKELDQFIQAQHLARDAIRKAIEDPAFRQILAEDASIDNEWPV